MALNDGSLVLFAGADRTNFNRVAEALGRGPESVSRKLAASPDPEWDADVAGWYAWQAGSTAEFDMWAQLVGVVPTLDDNGDPIDWSEWGLTTAEVAAATALLSVYAYSSNDPQDGFVAATVSSLDPPLYVIPDPPL